MSRTTVFYCSCGARLEGSSARLFHRCPPTNAQQEPGYPNHGTVAMSLRYPEMTAHLPTPRCSIQEPHQTTECGEFVARTAEKADEP